MEKVWLNYIENKQYGRLKQLLADMNAADISLLFDDVEEKQLPLIFRLLPKELAAQVFVEMDSDMQELLIHSFSDKELKEVMDELFMDDTVDIIEEMPATVAKRILKQQDPASRRMINQILAYPEDSVGSVMTTEYIDLNRHMTIKQAFDKIRRVGFETESIYCCYVISNSRRLLGIVSLKDLLLNPIDTVIGDIMEETLIFSHTHDDRELAVQQINKYDLLAIPVVDNEGRLVGIVTVDDAMDVLTEELSEDMDMMAAIVPNEKTYFKIGVLETFRSRIPWLLFLMISATFTGMIIAGFEEKLTACIALIAFIPMLMGTGGNAGSQSAVTVIRALSLGDITFRDIGRVFWKELRVSVICGVVLGVISLLKLYLVDHLLLGAFDIGMAIGEMLTVAITLVFVVILAKLVGATLPIIAKRLGFDPAVMASPLVTTILDALSLLLYFGVAAALLGL